MPNIDRREFLKLVGAGGVSVGAGFMLREANKDPREYLIPHVLAPEDSSSGLSTWYNSVCSMCPAGCGISVRTREGRAKKIEGNPSHPVSQGRLCSLGQAGLQALYNPDRLTAPMRRTGAGDSASFEEITWEQGLTQVGDRLDLLRAARRGNRVAFLTEGVRGHLAQLFESFMRQLGSPRLLHYDFDHPHTLYAANQQFFGENHLPYYDLQNTRLLLSFGADYLNNWISPVHHSLGFGESRHGRPDIRGRFVQIEPRMSMSGAAADEWIAAKPGTEGILALGLAHHIVAEGNYSGADRGAWVTALADYTPAAVAEQTGVPLTTITRLADSFVDTAPSLAIGGGAAGNHSNGVDTLVAVNVLNYLAGNIGREGGLLFNPEPAGPTSQSHQASYSTMLELAEAARQGEIDVLIINGTNPVFSLPPTAEFAQALAQIPLVVSLSSFLDETAALADVILPSHTYLESWGDDFPEPGVGFSVGAVSQPVVSPLYNTRGTGDIILDLARRMGSAEVMPWNSMEEFLKYGWRRIYQRGDPETLAQGFDAFWTSVLKAGAWGETSSGNTAFTLNPDVIAGIGVAPPEFSGSEEDYPFILHPYLSPNLHDGRGANLPWMQELPDPMTSVVYGSWVEINPQTAEQMGLTEGDLVDIQSPHGQLQVPVYIYPAIMPNVVAMPIGQGHSEYGRYAKDRGVNPIEILSPQIEPVTGNLATSATRVSVTATGKRVKLVKTGGTSRDLGRDIVQTTGGLGVEVSSAADNSIPITEVTT
ncbi:MAG: molybdopterin-dependent oxidoreductase [Proteobacteria bacterium]|nr:molybdopterin-dependent oxidoreductase [Pseudomonadota bacterium]